MKKLLLLLGLVAMIVSQAQALDIKGDDFEIHLKDATTIYDSQTGDPRAPNFAQGTLGGAVPLPPPPGYDGTLYAAHGAVVGDESRSVSQIDQIAYQHFGNVNIPNGVLLGLTFNLYVGAPLVNTPALVVEPFMTTLAIDPGLRDAANIAGATRLQLWLDPTPDDFNGSGAVNQDDVFNPLGDGNAPTHWVPDALGAGYDGFPNVNLPIPVNPGDEEDAILWLDMIALPIALDGTVLIESIFPTLGSSSSTDAYLLILGGAGAPQFEKGVFTTPLGEKADLLLAYTQRFPPSAAYSVVDNYAYLGGWQLESSDPIQGRGFGVIPEPASISLLGLGIAGLIGYRRRQKK